MSAQLGHADVAVTARHYARWIEGDGYRDPMRLEPGEVPADLLARLSDPTTDFAALLGVEHPPQVLAIARGTENPSGTGEAPPLSSCS
ncbi:MAG: hypothetical protein JRH16_18990 [Deltaproteobacteria bacterium]|nr:hypothetical protein [Deltaproteobacteria bacterium]MBW2362209.1 hypothetical protein [Deltaproteobacteria bacterium]